VIKRAWALEFAREWIDAWNSHDLERILSHYSEDFEMTSPFIVERMSEPSGVLKGKAAIRPYWSKGLAPSSPLRFELIEVFEGVRSITLHYRRHDHRLAAEVLEFNDRGEVVRGMAHYGPPA
jgi:ketosteroid isomerase-like protein